MQHHNVGETVPLEGSFTDSSGAPANPTTMTLTITAPDGTVTTITDPPGDPDLTHPAVGEWVYQLDFTAAGVWQYQFAGAGAGVDVTEPARLIAVGLVDRPGDWCEHWCTWEQVVAATPSDLSSLDGPEQQDILDFTTSLLFGMTGARYPGLCHGTFSVCSACRGCYPPRWGGWRSWWAGCCCGPWDRADLSDTGYPAVAALEVTIEGVALPKTDYRIDERRWLVRLDGDAWPRCPDLTDPDDYQVELVYGRVPPYGADRAAARLAAEIAKFDVGGDCALPAEVVQVVREGITYRTVDAKELFKDGLTGIAATDRWLAAEHAARQVGPGGSDPARDGELLRLGTDTGMDA